MHFEFGLRSSILLIFFTHLVVYAFLSFKRGIRNSSNADKFLGGFLFLAALFIFPWMAGFAGWYDTQPYREILFYIPFVHGLYLGPLLYLYVKSLTNYRYRLGRKGLYHFIPGTLYLIYSVLIVVVDKWFVGDYYLMNGHSDPDFADWYGYLWLLSLVVYLMLSIRHYSLYNRFIPYELSFAESATFTWLRNFLYAFSLLALASIVLNVLFLFFDLEYRSTWYYFLFFALIVYYIAINGYSVTRVPLQTLRFEPELLLTYTNPGPLLPAPATDEYIPYEEVVKKPEQEKAIITEWRQKIERLMASEKLYLQPELTLSDLAKKLNTNTSFLSKVINQSFKLNFNDYINQQRVEDVVEKMKDPEYANQTFLSIAFDAGFNSKSTFNRAFLKFKGQSPKDYFSQIG